MKKKNKLKRELVRQYLNAVVKRRKAYKKYRDYKAQFTDKCPQSDDLILADRTRECAVMDGNVDGLKNALRIYYSEFEIRLITDAANHRYNCSYMEGVFDDAPDLDDVGDDGDDDTSDSEDDDSDDSEDNQCSGRLVHTDDAVIQAMKGNESN